MTEFKTWKEYINQALTDSGQFEKSTSGLKGETETEAFKSSDKNSLTEIRVGYINDNSLIYLHIFNPIVPGYNKYVEGEYFYYFDFDNKNSYGKPALEFNQQNRNGILSILENGLKGKEIQFIKNNKVLKSKLYLSGNNPNFNFSYSYDFTNRSFLNKLFSHKIDKINGIERREIELNTIFSGIKNIAVKS